MSNLDLSKKYINQYSSSSDFIIDESLIESDTDKNNVNVNVYNLYKAISLVKRNSFLGDYQNKVIEYYKKEYAKKLQALGIDTSENLSKISDIKKISDIEFINNNFKYLNKLRVTMLDKINSNADFSKLNTNIKLHSITSDKLKAQVEKIIIEVSALENNSGFVSENLFKQPLKMFNVNHPNFELSIRAKDFIRRMIMLDISKKNVGYSDYFKSIYDYVIYARNIGANSTSDKDKEFNLAKKIAKIHAKENKNTIVGINNVIDVLNLKEKHKGIVTRRIIKIVTTTLMSLISLSATTFMVLLMVFKKFNLYFVTNFPQLISTSNGWHNLWRVLVIFVGIVAFALLYLMLIHSTYTDDGLFESEFFENYCCIPKGMVTFMIIFQTWFFVRSEHFFDVSGYNIPMKIFGTSLTLLSLWIELADFNPSFAEGYQDRFSDKIVSSTPFRILYSNPLVLLLIGVFIAWTMFPYILNVAAFWAVSIAFAISTFIVLVLGRGR